MQDYADKILRLSVRLEQLTKGATGDMLTELRLLQKQITELLAGTYPLATKKQMNEVKRLAKELTDTSYLAIADSLNEYSTATATASSTTQLATFSALGLSVDKKLQKKQIEKVVADSMQRIMPDPRNQQMTVGQILERFYRNGSNSIQNVITRSYQEGTSISGITALIREQFGLQKRQAESMARTSILASANQSRDYVADSVGVDKAIWMATLDAKTCPYCQGQDGKCKDVDKIPHPPAHVNCRCVLLYLPPGTSCSEMKSELTRPERGADGKQVPTNKYENYGEWIKTQPIGFQEEVLGKKRAKALNDGTVTFNSMYTRTGSRRTVDSLLEHYDG